jgi:23S rRNA (cytosine1962-C5)-methyltransferase
MHELIIHSSKTESLRRRHPWIFSGALVRGQLLPPDGARVKITDQQGKIWGIGHFQSGGSIAIRILTFKNQIPDLDFWISRLQDALMVRQTCIPGFGASTNCFRWIHGEGDGLPGLIIDVYGSAVIVQCHSQGMMNEAHLISEAIKKVFEIAETIFLKPADNKLSDGLKGYVHGSAKEGIVTENGISMKVNWETGQKTGFFLDQRENRTLLRRYVEGAEVWDLFCNTGGFSLNAIAGGAKKVISVDISETATLAVKSNLQLNGWREEPHQIINSDILLFLKETEEKADAIILDPPAFAKSISKRHNAVQAYKRHNIAAMKAIRPGGILFTFSCSQVVDEALFYHTIVAAAIESQRHIRVLHKLTQGPDHPVNIYHKEGAYLKGLVLQLN